MNENTIVISDNISSRTFLLHNDCVSPIFYKGKLWKSVTQLLLFLSFKNTPLSQEILESKDSYDAKRICAKRLHLSEDDSGIILKTGFGKNLIEIVPTPLTLHQITEIYRLKLSTYDTYYSTSSPIVGGTSTRPIGTMLLSMRNTTITYKESYELFEPYRQLFVRAWMICRDELERFGHVSVSEIYTPSDTWILSEDAAKFITNLFQILKRIMDVECCDKPHVGMIEDAIFTCTNLPLQKTVHWCSNKKWSSIFKEMPGFTRLVQDMQESFKFSVSYVKLPMDIVTLAVAAGLWFDNQDTSTKQNTLTLSNNYKIIQLRFVKIARPYRVHTLSTKTKENSKKLQVSIRETSLEKNPKSLHTQAHPSEIQIRGSIPKEFTAQIISMGCKKPSTRYYGVKMSPDLFGGKIDYERNLMLFKQKPTHPHTTIMVQKKNITLVPISRLPQLLALLEDHMENPSLVCIAFNKWLGSFMSMVLKLSDAIYRCSKNFDLSQPFLPRKILKKVMYDLYSSIHVNRPIEGENSPSKFDMVYLLEKSHVKLSEKSENFLRNWCGILYEILVNHPSSSIATSSKDIYALLNTLYRRRTFDTSTIGDTQLLNRVLDRLLEFNQNELWADDTLATILFRERIVQNSKKKTESSSKEKHVEKTDISEESKDEEISEESKVSEISVEPDTTSEENPVESDEEKPSEISIDSEEESVTKTEENHTDDLRTSFIKSHTPIPKKIRHEIVRLYR